MGNIRVLEDIVASQVAAGEVVERPASVVKELIENSLDASAKRVELEFVRSGTVLIRVSDDGRGMDREDALLCLEQHATSKLRSGRDLGAISTFGFRGEAIPSIASVSKFRMTTRSREAEVGTEVVVHGGHIETVRESGEAYGTQIEVRSLFFNVPARKKFLCGLQTEAAHIIHQLHCLALGNPGVAFIGIRDGRKFVQLAPTGELEVRVYDLFGTDGMKRLTQGEPTEVEAIRIRGFLSQPGIGRIDRSEQYIFVNSRPVRSSAISATLREAYHGVLPKGYQPGAILFLEMDPALVDCNVHPAKKEVRFQEIAAVREAVMEFTWRMFKRFRRGPSHIVSLEVSKDLQAAPLETPEFKMPPLEIKKEIKQLQPCEPSPVELTNRLAKRTCDPNGDKSEEEIPIIPEQMEIQNLLELRDLVVVGKIATRFAILEGSFGMVVADLRAARERILFERLLNEMRQGYAMSQPLLFPSVFDLPPRDVAWLAENVELLQRVGFTIECFRGASVKVEAVPNPLNKTDIQKFLVRLIDDLIRGGIRAGQRVAEEAIARSVARLAGEEALPTELKRIEGLLLELLQCELPYSCPMGKATMIPIPLSELKRRFGRGC